jgi:CDP-glucose 4,6-dehydratase
VIDLVNLIIKISGKTRLKPKILRIATGEIKAQYLSIKKAKDMLGWRPQFNLNEGIKETYQWYKDFFKKTKVK